MIHERDGTVIFPKAESIPQGGWSNIPLLNGLNGFKTSNILAPFPDVRAVGCVKDSFLRDILREDLMQYMARKQIVGILASNKYLFEVAKNHLPSVYSQNSLALWLFSKSEGNFRCIPAVPLTNNFFSYLRPIKRLGDYDTSEFIVKKHNNRTQKVKDSFEERVKKGTIFLTFDYAEDFKRLLRAYENRLLNEEDLDIGCSIILKHILECGSVVKPSDRKSFDLSIIEYARRSAFEKGIRFFGQKKEPFLPTDLSSVKIKIVSDVPDKYYSPFIAMLQNHFTVEKNDSVSVNYVVWLCEKQEITEANISKKSQEIRLQNPEAKIALLVADPSDYFKVNGFPEEIDALYTGTSEWDMVWEFLAQALFAGINVEEVRNFEDWYEGIRSFSLSIIKSRLKFGVPEEVSMITDSLIKIDSLMLKAIQEKALPGGQIVVARNGVVVWNKAYGFHTYEKKQPVLTSDIYDLASITKIAATVPALMKLYDDNKWELKDTLGRFLPQLNSTEKASLTIEELLLHESGLASYIPFYLQAVDETKLKGRLFANRYSWLYNIKLDDYIYLNRTVTYRKDVFSHKPDTLFSVPVAQNWFMNKNYLDSIMQQVLESPLHQKGRYRYSDLGFYLLGKMITELTNSSLDTFTYEYFYGPMGMKNTAFRPLEHFEKERIVPTENDKAFRKQLLHGWVQDPGAAMMGGVAGHAGLFANALDIAKMMQLYLNGGHYGGKEYIKSNTIKLFTSRHNDKNRRGLGFDKPESDTTKVNPVSSFASPASFGHSGFTGTLAWADPLTGIVYVFLSNRVHPNQYNKKLIEENYRTTIQDIIYNSIIGFNEKFEWENDKTKEEYWFLN
ncbi:serine hydrolase domain-containing protein [Thermophagus xiamenensis]|nr:serine hydrolase [Thermophagus xiamenensis]